MDEKNEESKRPEDSAFKQQRLKAWQPLLTPPWVIGTFAVIGALFLIIGGVVLSTSRSVVEYEQRYDLICSPYKICNVTIDIKSKMEAPVFFYYKLTNFYQNHRRYVKSRDDAQLSGESFSESPSACEPMSTYERKTLYPCGLIAGSFFNDTFTACVRKTTVDGNDTQCEDLKSTNWNREGIAWASDKDKKFKSRKLQSFETKDGPNGKLPDVDNEDFIVWMRTAGLPTFKKLYRKIENRNFEAGETLVVTINNTYPVSSFEGEKAVVLSTTSWLGGKNDFLGIAYIVVGAICVVLAIAFWLKHHFARRPMGDISSLPGFNQPRAPTKQ